MKFKQSSGQTSKILLILAVAVFIIGVVAYLIIVAVNSKPKSQNQGEGGGNNLTPEVPELVFEKQLGDIKFNFISARDFGQNLTVANMQNEKYAKQASYQTVYKTTTGRFLQVSVGATNMGKIETAAGIWDLLNVVDSEGRNYIPAKGYQFDPWLPPKNGCGAILKPAFEPVPCVKMYEISDESKDLKITISNKRAAASKENAAKTPTDVLDVVIK